MFTLGGADLEVEVVAAPEALVVVAEWEVEVEHPSAGGRVE